MALELGQWLVNLNRVVLVRHSATSQRCPAPRRAQEILAYAKYLALAARYFARRWPNEFTTDSMPAFDTPYDS
jgi:hypothetical protein